ncbi:MAG: right-handed parallel beta-helix repeat-containing protein [Armatimonadota bacterium]|nr:right-handed parallel beta-helix repeat-containing protein [Armatimonadota bacterium]
MARRAVIAGIIATGLGVLVSPGLGQATIQFCRDVRPGPTCVAVRATVEWRGQGNLPPSHVSAQLPGPTPAAVYEPPATISSDGSADVTAALNAWLANVPNGATVRFRPGAVYRIDREITLTDRRGLTFEGDVTFRAGPEPADLTAHQRRTLSVFRLQGGGGYTFRGIRIIGRHPAGGTAEAAYDATREAQHGFWLAGVQGITIEGTIISDVYGDFVYVGPDLRSGVVWSRNVTIRGGEMTRNGRQGIAMVAVDGMTVEGVRLYNLRRAVFNMEPTTSSWGARNVRIIGNRTGAARLLWFSSAGQGWNVSDVVISRNVMETATGVPFVYMVAPRGGYRGPLVVEHNTMISGGSPAPGMRFDRVRVIVRNNLVTFPPRRLMTAVGLTDAEATVQGDRFCGAARAVGADPLSRVTESDNVLVCP